jgi:hypothetical protein
MTKLSIPTDLQSSVVQTANELRELASLPVDSWERTAQILQALNRPGTAASNVMAQVAADESLGKLRGGWLSFGGGGMLLQSHVFPTRLISLGLAGGDIAGAIDSAKRFATSGESSIEVYAPVVGLRATEVIDLEEGFALIPWEQVPEGLAKNTFSGNQDYYVGQFFLPRAAASSAFRISLPARQILFASNEEAATLLSMAPNEVAQTSARVADAVRCAVVLSGRTIVAVGSWSHFADPVAQMVGPSGYSWSHEFTDMSLLAAAHEPQSIDGPAFSAAFQNFLRLPESEQAALRIVLDRINVSLRRATLVDRAIDLGIALEAMMLHDSSQSKDRGELRYRTAIRGAAFVGGTREERARNFRIMREAYDIRSEAVHAGKLDEKKKNRRDASPIIADASQLTLSIARKIIGLARFPVWEDYVLHGNDGDTEERFQK